MEGPGDATSAPAPTARRRTEIGPGLRKLRPREYSRRFEEDRKELDTPGKVFSKPIEVTIPAGYSATDFEVPHTFGTIPSNMLLGPLSANTTVWKGTKDWTRTAIYLRSGAAVSFTLYLVP